MSDRGFNLTVEGNANRLILHLDTLPDELRAALKAKIGQMTNALLHEVKAAEPHRTGRLRSMTRAYVDEGEDWVRGRVRVLGGGRHNIAAAALEYGAHRSFTVRGSAGSYQRRANLTARRFLRGPAAALLPHARIEIERAINDALAEVKR